MSNTDTSTTADDTRSLETKRAWQKLESTQTFLAVHVAVHGKDRRAQAKVLVTAMRAALKSYRATLDASLAKTYALLDDAESWADGDAEGPALCFAASEAFASREECPDFASPIESAAFSLATDVGDPNADFAWLPGLLVSSIQDTVENCRLSASICTDITTAIGPIGATSDAGSRIGVPRRRRSAS